MVNDLVVFRNQMTAMRTGRFEGLDLDARKQRFLRERERESRKGLNSLK